MSRNVVVPRRAFPPTYYGDRPPMPGVPSVQQFGQIKVLPPPWSDGEARVVLMGELPVAKVVTAFLQLKDPNTMNQRYQMLWRLTLGAGGAQTQLLIDALGSQQINVPASRFTIELLCRSVSSAGFTVVNPVTAVAFIGEYPVSSGSARLTSYFRAVAAATVTVPAPDGAAGWRLDGPREAVGASPFKALVDVLLRGPLTANPNSYTGLELLNTPRLTADFLPMPGGTQDVQIVNGSADDIEGKVIWELDL